MPRLSWEKSQYILQGLQQLQEQEFYTKIPTPVFQTSITCIKQVIETILKQGYILYREDKRTILKENIIWGQDGFTCYPKFTNYVKNSLYAPWMPYCIRLWQWILQDSRIYWFLSEPIIHQTQEFLEKHIWFRWKDQNTTNSTGGLLILYRRWQSIH